MAPSFSRFLFRAVRKGLVRPLEQWWSGQEAILLLEALDSLGQGVVVNGPIFIGNPAGTSLGDDVCINPHLGVHGAGRLTIGSHVHFGQNVEIHTENHNYNRPTALPYDPTRIAKDVVIGDSVWLCSHAIIVPGVTIGEGAVIGAGAVVTKDVPPLAVVGGSPATVVRQRDDATYAALKAEEKFLGWPRDYDLVNGRKLRLKRRAR